MEFSQSDINQLASLVASQVVEQLTKAGYQTGVSGTSPQMEQSQAESNRKFGNNVEKQRGS